MGILARVYLWRAGYPANGGQPYYAKAAYWANEVKKSNKHKMNPDVEAIWRTWLPTNMIPNTMKVSGKLNLSVTVLPTA